MLRQSQLMKFLLSKSYRAENRTKFTSTQMKKKCTFYRFPISGFFVVVVLVVESTTGCVQHRVNNIYI